MYYIIGLILGTLTLAVMLERKRIEHKRKRFEGRNPIQLKAIHSEYYSSKNVEYAKFADLWMKIGALLKIDSRLLRPSDRFDVELAEVHGFPTPDELEDLEDYYKQEWVKLNKFGSPPKIHNLDDLVNRLCT